MGRYLTDVVHTQWLAAPVPGRGKPGLFDVRVPEAALPDTTTYYYEGAPTDDEEEEAAGDEDAASFSSTPKVSSRTLEFLPSAPTTHILARTGGGASPPFRGGSNVSVTPPLEGPSPS